MGNIFTQFRKRLFTFSNYIYYNATIDKLSAKPLKLNGFLRQDNRVSVTSLSKKVKIEPVQSGSSPEKMKCFILFLPLSLVGLHQEFNLIVVLQLD